MFGDHHLPHLSETFLCTCQSILARLSKGKIKPVAVNFIHQGTDRTQDRAEYEQCFNTPVQFLSNADELVMDARDLDITIELADPSLLNVLERYATQMIQSIPIENLWSGKVISLISNSLLSGHAPLMDDIARELAVSGRLLQEKLKKEGTSFRILLQTVRKKIAMNQLSNPDMSICEVAFMLGYSDQSAFNHAFKQWTGKSPGEFVSRV